ncbi:hypothetical protein BDZ89DRAFT_1064886 [Hymenopellis radicata]|nr:hypothetical protein BDZ89DRAFT_1082955 [Hymenopellis radicata]KAF9030096.1 hypothetical protein BDZ89DRAFT_1064886 [Hymenopellis radicata]
MVPSKTRLTRPRLIPIIPVASLPHLSTLWPIPAVRSPSKHVMTLERRGLPPPHPEILSDAQ